MYINEPALKGNLKKKTQTTAKSINQYEFSPLQPLQPPQNTTESASKKAVRFINQNKHNTANSTLGMAKIQSNNQIKFDPERQYIIDEMQFEDNLVIELNSLLQKWEKSLKTIKTELIDFQQVDETENEERAFDRCIRILDAQFNKSQVQHQANARLVEKKLLQVDDYKLRIMKEINDAHERNSTLLQDKQKLQHEEQARNKEREKKKSVMEKIAEERDRISQYKKQLLDSKQKSLEQKNDFIEIQSEEFRLESSINQLEQQSRNYEEEVVLGKKYEELLKVKQAVVSSLASLEEEVRPHMQRKIEKIAKLRSEVKSIDEALEVCTTKCEDQNIIIEALKEKSYRQQANQVDEQDLFSVYKKRYSEIYFGGKNNADWRDYSSYLRQLINKNKHMNERVYTEMPTPKNLTDYSTPMPNKTHPVDSDMLDGRNEFAKRRTKEHFFRGSAARQDQRQHMVQSQTPGMVARKGQQQERLPSIMKSKNRTIEDEILKAKAKEQIIKLKKQQNNEEQAEQNQSKNRARADYKRQSDFQLSSIKSNESRISGEVIEVQFHKK